MEPNKPLENDKRDLYEALEVLAWLEEREIKDKRGNVTGYRIEEGLDQMAMMRATVVLGQLYRDRINISQLCKDRGVKEEIVPESSPKPAPLPSEEFAALPKIPGGAALKYPTTRIRVPMNAPASANHHGKIASILF